REPMTDEHGEPVTIWDGISYKESPTTGELIPDESGRTTVYRYINPTRAEWPEADYIVGNPPFIGNKRMRIALGDGYIDALKDTFSGEVSGSADFVMYWWHFAAEKARHGEVKRFGFITTNSLRQTFNRRVIEPHLNDSKKPLSLAFAIPDHPWVDSADGASVRIAMTVGTAGDMPGTLYQVVEEKNNAEEGHDLTLSSRTGKLFSDLSVGANVAGAVPLKANAGLSSRGVIPVGSGFTVEKDQAITLGLGSVPGLENHIRHYRNGRDMNQRPREVMIIDLFGLGIDEVRERYPAVYQWLLDRVKPEREQNRAKRRRDKWWIFGDPAAQWRAMSNGLTRFITTVYVSKHRVFFFLDEEVLPDDGLVSIAADSPKTLGVLSSRPHALWALAAGGRMGMGNDPRYNKSRCFETFPFPDLNDAQARQIGELAERIDAHRKRQQAAHPDLTLTGMYNVLEKLRAGTSLTTKEQTIHEQGLVSVLRELHDELDRAVFAAYGWDDLADRLVGRPGATTPLPDKPAEQAEAEEELLTRLVDLNAQRAAEEAQGEVRWLRPDYQAPEADHSGSQTAVALQVDPEQAPAAGPAAKTNWPRDMAAQVTAVRELLASSPQTPEQIAARFKRRPIKAVEQVLAALQALGQARNVCGVWQIE
ncbi:MAG: DNA methyltransferase, partial [Halothiobacillaceae bacterium]